MSTRSSIRSWTDAYLALKAHLESLRGFVEIGDARDAERWPRTTGDDVIAIAAMLDHAFVGALPIFGTENLRRRWLSCLGDLERAAWIDPDQTYAENHPFWTCVRALCVHLDAADAPVPDAAFWDGFFLDFEQRHGEGLRNGGAVEQGPFARFDGIKTYDDMYIAQYKYLRDKRGADTMGQPTEKVAGYDVGGGTFPVPRTTNSDVLQLAAYWSHAFANARAVLNDHNAVARQWAEVMADIDRLAKGADPNAVYPKNNIFWRVVEDISTNVAVAAEAPTKWDLFVGALEQSIAHLPETLEHSVEWAGRTAKTALGDAAGAAGEVANKLVKGAFDGIATPLLIGGGVLAAFLLLRNDDRAERAEVE